ncbi:MAG: hypothetical protein HZB53_06180 [Chloroflexi bacterium]|nr:hypothetical protein [Chloroflexota bacterium]
MGRHTTTAHGLIYTVVDDVTLVYRVVAHGQLFDAVSGRALTQAAFVSLDRNDVAAKVLGDGLFCLAAHAEHAFPKHDTQTDTVQATFRSQGYADQTVAIVLPAAAPFPIAVAPVRLRPNPVLLAGRVNQATGAQAPIAGALVTAQDAASQHALILRTPLANRYLAGASVSPVPPTGATQTLVQTVEAGVAVLVLNSALAATRVEVSDGVQSEQIDVGALSDADGYYRMRGIGGVAGFSLRCDSGPQTQTTEYAVNYGQPVNRVDFAL